MGSIFQRVYRVIGLGGFGSNSHPVHPAIFHFPIAFLSLANTLNLLYGITVYAPALSPFTADKQNITTFTNAGYFFNLVSIVSSIPAILTRFAAYLGGSLVYKHSVGVQRIGDGAEEKKKSQ